MLYLTKNEITLLNKLTESSNIHICKRAKLILLSENENSTKVIAKVVGFTEKTVKKWLTEFPEKRMEIFPQKFIESITNLSAEVVEEKSESVAEETESKEISASAEKEVTEQISEPKRKTKSKKVIGLQKSMKITKASKKILQFFFNEMVSCENGTIKGKNIEELHEMRVSTRKMRVAMVFFKDSLPQKNYAKVLKQMKKTGANLGVIRDLDVLIYELPSYFGEISANEQKILSPYIDYILGSHQKKRKNLVKYLKSSYYKKFKKDFKKFINSSRKLKKKATVPKTSIFAKKTLLAVLEEIIVFEPKLENPKIKTLHELRIAFKKFRYNVEFFKEILSEEHLELLDEIKGIQDYLGILNDTDFVLKTINEFSSTLKKKKNKKLIKVLGNFSNLIREIQSDLVLSFPSIWERFKGNDFNQNLNTLLEKI